MPEQNQPIKSEKFSVLNVLASRDKPTRKPFSHLHYDGTGGATPAPADWPKLTKDEANERADETPDARASQAADLTPGRAAALGTGGSRERARRNRAVPSR